jgi:hypothetical protein
MPRFGASANPLGFWWFPGLAGTVLHDPGVVLLWRVAPADHFGPAHACPAEAVGPHRVEVRRHVWRHLRRRRKREDSKLRRTAEDGDGVRAGSARSQERRKTAASGGSSRGRGSQAVNPTGPGAVGWSAEHHSPLPLYRW